MEDLSEYSQQPVKSLRDRLRSIEPSNQNRSKTISDMLQVINELDDDAQPQLLQDIDRLFWPNLPSRAFDYSRAEKAALLALESTLVDTNYSSNKAAFLIADIWQTMGPIREEWKYSDRRQAVRRLLQRMKKRKV